MDHVNPRGVSGLGGVWGLFPASMDLGAPAVRGDQRGGEYFYTGKINPNAYVGIWDSLQGSAELI